MPLWGRHGDPNRRPCSAAQGNPEARPASTRSTLIGIIASRMCQYRRNESDTTVDFRRNYGDQRSFRSSVASMLASVQKPGKAHTHACVERKSSSCHRKYGKERCLSKPIHHISTSSWCAKTSYLEAYSEICQAENVVSRRNSIIIIRIHVSVVQFESKLRSHYESIYEYIRNDGRNDVA